MKKILIIGAGAMGSAFSVPCVDNNNEVSLIGTFLENELIRSLKANNNFHPALKINLPKQLIIDNQDNILLHNLIENYVRAVIATIPWSFFLSSALVLRREKTKRLCPSIF